MRNKHNIMIDIETTGLIPGVHNITSIAIVYFTRDEELRLSPYETFKYWSHVRVLETLANRFVWDPETWVFRKGAGFPEAEAELVPMRESEAVQTVNDMLQNLFCEHSIIPHDVTIWAKGTDFDIAFLNFAFHKWMLKPAWKYNMVRDVRTHLDACEMVDFETSTLISNIEEKWKLVPHNALHDCFAQILSLGQCEDVFEFIKPAPVRKEGS